MDTLSNDFHNTTIRVRSKTKALVALGRFTRAATPAERKMAKRIRDGLCGANGCTCGIVRGPQS